jgi:hypothetical protein
MRRPAFLLVLAVLLLSGCVSRPQESSGGQAAASPPPATANAAKGFAIVGLAAVPADGSARAVREDDNVTLRFSLRNDAAAGAGPASFLVSYLVSGAVRDVETITLAPGASRAFAYPLGILRDVAPVDVEVRAGDQDAKLHLDDAAWPRFGQEHALGPLGLDVASATPTPDGGSLLVNLSVQQQGAAWLGARVLCADASGNVTAMGYASVPLAGPGTTTATNLSLPACPYTLYGVELSGGTGPAPDLYERVLFVPIGWRP